MLQVKLQVFLIYSYNQLLIFGYSKPEDIGYIGVIHFDISCFVKKQAIPLIEV